MAGKLGVVGRQAFEPVGPDGLRAELLDLDIELAGREARGLEPEKAVGARTDDAQQQLTAAGELAGDAEGVGDAVTLLGAEEGRLSGGSYGDAEAKVGELA